MGSTDRKRDGGREKLGVSNFKGKAIKFRLSILLLVTSSAACIMEVG